VSGIALRLPLPLPQATPLDAASRRGLAAITVWIAVTVAAAAPAMSQAAGEVRCTAKRTVEVFYCSGPRWLPRCNWVPEPQLMCGQPPRDMTVKPPTPASEPPPPALLVPLKPSR